MQLVVEFNFFNIERFKKNSKVRIAFSFWVKYRIFEV